MSRTRISLVVLLAVLGGALSGLLLFEHYGVGTAAGAVDQLCGPEGGSGCDQVSQSRYAAVGGVSVAGVGLFFYGSMLLLMALALVAGDTARRGATTLALLVFGLALVVDLVLLGVQAFAIGAFCKLCIATYGVNLAAFAVLFPGAAKPRDVTATLFRGEGRSALGVWAAGSLILLLTIGAVEHALAVQSSERAAELLGEPSGRAPEPAPRTEADASPELESPPPSDPPGVEPEPVAETEQVPPARAAAPDTERIESLEAELERAQARIRELRETLDDPEKFQEYQAEKAARQFEQEEEHDIELTGVPFKGPAGAPIRVVEFSDFLCPYCRNLAAAFQNYLPQSGGRVAIYFKNYPLDQACNPELSRTIHDGACELALGAICAHEQGKFWPFHDQVFTAPPENPGNADVVRIAVSAGLDGDALRACLDSREAQQVLADQIQEASRLEVRATPTVFVNGKRLEQLGGFLKAIESEAQRLGLQ